MATASRDGVPHVVPIVYAIRGTKLYFVIDDKPKATRTGLKRLRNIAQNPAVAILVDRYDEDWQQLKYVLLRGEAELVATEAEFRLVIRSLRRRYPQYRAMPLAFDTHPLVRVEILTSHSWSGTHD